MDGHATFGPLLFGVAVLLVAAKAGGVLAERWRQPPVLGELVVGIGLGNLLLPLLGHHAAALGEDRTLAFLAEIGVLILLFDVGLEADLRSLVRVGPSSLLVAVIGVVVPIALGWGAAAWLLPDQSPFVHLFVGATLSATSVGITARVLRDLGAAQSREGQIILGAAIVDDVLGLVVLAVVGGLVRGTAGGDGVSPLGVGWLLLRVALFLALTIGFGRHLSGPILKLAARTGHREAMLVFGLALCFTLAFVAELVGLAAIVGAFAAGVMLDPYGAGVRAREQDETLNELLHPLSSLFVPLFFILMGLQVDIRSIAQPSALAFAGILLACAFAGKLACALGVVTGGVRRLPVAIGMLPRGEVGLIFAGIGTTLTLDGQPVLSPALFSAVVLMVVATTLVAPIGLRWALGPRPPG